jgi:hypothetical protein
MENKTLVIFTALLIVAGTTLLGILGTKDVVESYNPISVDIGSLSAEEKTIYIFPDSDLSAEDSCPSAEDSCPSTDALFLYREDALAFLTQAIYFEARGEPLDCQKAVGFVIINRRNSTRFPDTIREVIWQHRQFSYTQDGMHERMLDETSKHKAERIARELLNKKQVDITGGSLYYYNPMKASPSWGKKLDKTIVCGNHLFFK